MNRVERYQDKKDGLFSKRIVVCMFLFLLGFIIWVMLIFSRTGMEPRTLIISVFALFTGQFGFLHLLTKQRRQLKHDEDVLEEVYEYEEDTPDQDYSHLEFDELFPEEPVL